MKRGYIVAAMVATIAVGYVIYASPQKHDLVSDSAKENRVEVNLGAHKFIFPRRFLTSKYRDGGTLNGVVMSFVTSPDCSNELSRANEGKISKLDSTVTLSMDARRNYASYMTNADRVAKKYGFNIHEGWNVFQNVPSDFNDTYILFSKDGKVDPVFLCAFNKGDSARDQAPRCMMEFDFDGLAAIAFVSLADPSYANGIYEAVRCEMTREMH